MGAHEWQDAHDGRDYDVVVVGGGAAGLSGALTLARARRSVLVVDAASRATRPAAHVHNYLGREGDAARPSCSRSAARRWSGTAAQVVAGRVTVRGAARRTAST